jgi:putative hydrolase of the HAD superfamily
MSAVRAVIFDFHETLISADAWMALETGGLATAIPQALGVVTDPMPKDAGQRVAEAYARVRAISAAVGVEYSAAAIGRAVLRALERDDGVSDEALAAAVAGLYRRHVSGVTLKPGATPALDDLVTLGCRLAIVSNAAHPAFLEWALDRLGVRDRFGAVVVSADVGFRKPRVEIFEAAMRAVGVPADAAVYVGNDYLKDVMGAKLAGMRAVWMPDARAEDHRAYTTVQPDAVIDDLAALPPLVRGWMAG